MNDSPSGTLSQLAPTALPATGAATGSGVVRAAPAEFISAGTHLASHLRLWLVASIGLAVDLISKDWAVRNLDMRSARTVEDGLFSLRLSLNPGALFGIGAGWAPVFVGASVLALVFVVYLFWQSTPRQISLHLALGCVLGGAIGNLYDRSFVTAYIVELADGRRDVCWLVKELPESNEVQVRDFGTGAHQRRYPRDEIVRASMQPVVRDFLSIDWRFGDRPIWPWIFNIADALLVVGVIVLLFNFWFVPHRADAAAHGEAPGESA